MKFSLRSWLWPTTLVGRTVFILIAGLTTSHIVSFLIHDTDKREAVNLFGSHQLAERIVTISTLVSQSEGPERARIITAANGPTFQVVLNGTTEVPDDSGQESHFLREALQLRMVDATRLSIRVSLSKPDTGILETLRHLVGGGDTDHPMAQHVSHLVEYMKSGNTIRASVLLPDGNWLNFSVPARDALVSWTPRFILSIVVMFGAVVGFSFWAVNRTIAPLKDLTDAAERLGRNLDDIPLSVLGSVEVRRAAHAFNTMHARIQRFVEDRTRMIAAISHDLRTPLTRLRFRSELIGDETQRDKIVRDLEEMENMIEATLAFARDDARVEASAPTNLSDTIQQISEDMVELGHNVKFDGPDDVIVSGRPLALRRALSNIIENAVRYGGQAHVGLTTQDKDVIIMVEDDGPGVPDDQLRNIFEPFVRLDQSRNKESGGVGLGLSTSRNIVRGHGGDVILWNREPNGLRAEIRLPL